MMLMVLKGRNMLREVTVLARFATVTDRAASTNCSCWLAFPKYDMSSRLLLDLEYTTIH